MTGSQGRRRKGRDYSEPHRLFVEDTPQEVRAILEEAAGLRRTQPRPNVSAGKDVGVAPRAGGPAARKIGEIPAP